MRKFGLIVMMAFILSSSAFAEVVGENLTYRNMGQTFSGYIAYDDAVESRHPGIIVVHEWWGHNDYVRQRADMLAELGYTALAIDMYGEGKVAQHPEKAGEFASQALSNLDAARERFLAGMKVLKNHPTTNPENIAAIGYCFGGGVVLNMARMGVDLDGVVSFHGSLAGKVRAEPGKVKAKVLVLHGADDTFVSEEQIADFKLEMDEAGVDYTFIAYEDAIHSFTSPKADEYAEKFGLNVGYNKQADEKSWEEMKEFFNKIFTE